jgi:hypothetical protein
MVARVEFVSDGLTIRLRETSVREIRIDKHGEFLPAFRHGCSLQSESRKWRPEFLEIFVSRRMQERSETVGLPPLEPARAICTFVYCINTRKAVCLPGAAPAETNDNKRQPSRLLRGEISFLSDRIEHNPRAHFAFALCTLRILT